MHMEFTVVHSATGEHGKGVILFWPEYKTAAIISRPLPPPFFQDSSLKKYFLNTKF